mgnify:CR=1 FL=1
MAKLRLDQLNAALKKSIAPVYLVTGDETLLISEACDSIRQHAQKQGYIERELHHTDAGFQWDALNHSANSMSLFSDKKIIEIRVHNGKPGDAGSKAIVEYCQHADDQNLLLLVLPKIDKRSQNTKWFKAVEATGATISVWPISAQQLPSWIEQRMQRHGLSADRDAIDILCAKIEGNLLAAAQEIEKLKLLSDDTHITAQTMADAVTDSARYDVFTLVDKALMGDSRAAVTSLQGLRGEGTEPTLILWALSREIRTIALIKESMENGKSFGFCAKQAGVWDKRQSVIQHAVQRLHIKQVHTLVRKSGLADKMIKGIVRGDAWSELVDIVLSLAGTQALTPRTQRLSLQASR